MLECTEVSRPGFVYFAYAPELKRCKIGWTSRSPAERLGSKTDCADFVNIWGFLYATGSDMELMLHEHFNYLRLKGEWFAVDDKLYNFVQHHTYKDESAIKSLSWSAEAWQFWDSHCANDGNVRQLMGCCQTNPVLLIDRYNDPLNYWYGFVKSHLCSWIGYECLWRPEGDPLRSPMAYDLVYEMCVDLLPC